MDITRCFVEMDGIRASYLTCADLGNQPALPTVVLLHGGGLDSAELSWGLLIPELCAHYRVIAPDFPGYGESDRPKQEYTLDFYVDFLTKFLDVLNIQRASLAGLSMGGGVALGCALQQPDRVEKLVLVDSYGLQNRVPFHKLSYLLVKFPGFNELSWAMMRNRALLRYSLGSFLRRPGAVTPELVESIYQAVNRPNAGVAWMTFQKNEMQWSGARTCYMERLGEIHAPTLIIHGSRDTLVPHAAVREAHERITGSQLVWMEGCGHWPQRDNPAEFNRVIQEFLRS